MRESKQATKPRWRISIRYKMLLVISVVLLVAIGSYLYLATSLFRRDKLAYIYDLNSSLVGSLSEQTRSNLEVLVREAKLYAWEISRKNLDPAARQRIDAELFARDPDILQIAVFTGVKSGDKYQIRDVTVHTAGLEELLLTPAELSYDGRPLPLFGMLNSPDDLFVANSSLPPDKPMLTLCLRASADSVVALDLRHQRLLRIFGRSALHETYLVDESGVVLAHPDAKTVTAAEDRASQPLVDHALKTDVAQGVLEFRDPKSGVEYLGGFARVGLGRLFVLTQIPKDQALQASRELVKRSALFAIVIMLVSFLVSIFFSRYLAAPIRKLRAATEVIGEGRFNIEVDVTTSDEIGDLANAFNEMAKTLKSTQSQLVQSGKMAAFGQLGAGITHEVKNPLTGIVGFAQLAQRRVEDPEKTLELLRLIEKEGLRCRDILVNFLKFARAGAQERVLLDLNEVVAEGAELVRHQLHMGRVKVQVELDPQKPKIIGNRAELQQVLMNLAINAQQAMTGGGVVTFSTGVVQHGEESQAVFRVSDTGPGIPEEIRDRIFEPFFTTKPAGEGTGLGLSVSFGIIKAHSGAFELDTELGAGTTFTVRLPLAKRSDVAVAS